MLYTHITCSSTVCVLERGAKYDEKLNKAKILRVELGKFWYKEVNYVFWFFMLVEGVEKNWNESQAIKK